MNEENTKKIIFLEAVQDLGGATISTLELAQRLATKHEVTLLDFYGTSKPYLTNAAAKKLKVKIIEQRESEYIITTSKVFLIKLFKYFLFLPHLLKLRKKIIAIIKDINPDYVIINNFKVLSALIYFPDKKFKTLFFARGWFITSQISRIEKIMLKWVDRYVCVSQSTRQALFCGQITSLENLYVVQNAINESRLSKEKAIIVKREKTKIILHAAGFLKDKGQLVSLKIAKALKEHNVDFKLILAGLIYKGDESHVYYDHIKELVRKFNLEDNVEFVINQFNITSYFNACDILIHPSETEGLPRVVMEAMALKKPVIANAVGGVTDYILNGYTGFLPRHNSIADYVHYIEALINNEDLYNRISNNAYNLINTTYTEQNQLDSLFKVFDN